MEPDAVLRKQLVALLRGRNAHLPYDAAVADFPLNAINALPPHTAYSPWHLLEHLRITQWDILEFIRNPNYVSPQWPAGYWPPQAEQSDEAMWKDTIARFKKDQADLEKMVEDPAVSLTAELPHAPGYTIFREILVVSDHNAYHIGEFAILRQVMGTWPANRKE